MKILHSLVTMIFFLCQNSALYSQDTISLNTIIEKTQKTIQDYPTEKVYLHFDKPYYGIGDTMWFKGYLALGQNQPSDLSKILYVDILSDKDSVIKSLRLPVVNTSAYGSITLDPTLYKSGNYRVRAYTYWMINSGEAYFFHKNIRIGDALNRQVITHISLKSESTNPSPKINARILYKDPDGNPLDNRKISWKLTSNFQTLARGKETTDAQGAVMLTLNANQKSELDAAVLETELETPGVRTIISNFALEHSFPDADIQFFPEGGELIENLSGKVAFKAIQEKGLGISVKGEIVDDNGASITAIESQHLGMGTFTFLPGKGKTYKANLTFANGVKKSVPMPVVKVSGIALSAVNMDAGKIVIRISSNPVYYAANQNKSYYIVAQSKGIICYAAQIQLTSPVFNASIPATKFPAGLVQFTLFSNFGEPLTERLMFVNQPDDLTLGISTDKKTYSARQPVKMQVTAKIEDTPVEGNFSVAVINESKVPFDEDDANTILSSFLLSSELTGYIEKPNYYFYQITPKKRANLDALMLTQGYRKFSYKEILAGKKPTVSFLPEQGISYTGTLRSSNGMPVSKGSLRLVVPQSRFYAETSTNLKGQFEFKNLIIPDSAEATISARSPAGDRNMMIMLDGSAFPAIGKNVNAPDRILNIDSALSPYLENSKKQYKMSSQMLQEVVIKSTVIAKSSHKDYPALSGLSMPDHLIDDEKFKGCNIMLTCLQSSAPGLTYIEGKFYVSRVYNTGLKVPVQIFYNGMPVDAAFLNTILPSDVESVEIFLKDELGLVNRTYNTNGILVINSKKIVKKPVTAAELKALFPPDNVLTFNPFGYIKTREFYFPKYSSTASRSIGNDLRTTVYWNPKIFTDANGTMSFIFFNSDNKGSYKAIVEGTDIDGNLARTVYRYRVE